MREVYASEKLKEKQKEKRKSPRDQDERDSSDTPSPPSPPRFPDEGQRPDSGDMDLAMEPNELEALQELVEALLDPLFAQAPDARTDGGRTGEVLPLEDELARKYGHLGMMLREYRAFGYTSEEMKESAALTQGLQGAMPEVFEGEGGAVILQARKRLGRITEKLMSLKLEGTFQYERARKIVTTVRLASAALMDAAITRLEAGRLLAQAKAASDTDTGQMFLISENVHVAKEAVDLAYENAEQCLLKRFGEMGVSDRNVFTEILDDIVALRNELKNVRQGLQELKNEARSDQREWDSMRKANLPWRYDLKSFQHGMFFIEGLKGKFADAQYDPDVGQAIGMLNAIADGVMQLEVSNPNQLRATAETAKLLQEVTGALEMAAPTLPPLPKPTDVQEEGEHTGAALQKNVPGAPVQPGAAQSEPVSLDTAVAAHDAVRKAGKEVGRCKKKDLLKMYLESQKSPPPGSFVNLEELEVCLKKVEEKVEKVVSTQQSRQHTILLETLIKEFTRFQRRSGITQVGPIWRWQAGFQDVAERLLTIAKKELHRDDSESKFAKAVLSTLEKVWDVVITVESVLPNLLQSKSFPGWSMHMGWTEKALSHAVAKVKKIRDSTQDPLLGSKRKMNPVSQEYCEDFQQLINALLLLRNAATGKTGLIVKYFHETLDYAENAADQIEKSGKWILRKTTDSIKKVNKGQIVQKRIMFGQSMNVESSVLKSRAQVRVALTPVVYAMRAFLAAAEAEKKALKFESEVDESGRRTSSRKYGEDSRKKAMHARKCVIEALVDVETKISELRQALPKVEPRNLGSGKTVDDFASAIDAPVGQKNRTKSPPVGRFVFWTNRWWAAVNFQSVHGIERALHEAQQAKEEIERAVEKFTGKTLSVFSTDAKIALHLGEFFAECKKEHMQQYVLADRATVERAAESFDKAVAKLVNEHVAADFTDSTDPQGMVMAGRVGKAYDDAQKGILRRPKEQDQVLESVAGFRKSLARSGPRSLMSRLISTVVNGAVDALLTYTGAKIALGIPLRTVLLPFVIHRAFSGLSKSVMPGQPHPSDARWEVLRRTLTVYAFKVGLSLIPLPGAKMVASGGLTIYALSRDDRMQHLKRGYKASAVLEDFALAGSWALGAQGVRTWNDEGERAYIRSHPELFNREQVAFIRQNKGVINEGLVRLVEKHAAILPKTAPPPLSNYGATQFSTDTAPPPPDVGTLLANAHTDRDRIALIRDHPHLFNQRLAASVDRFSGYFTAQFVQFVKDNQNLIGKLGSGNYGSELIELTRRHPELFKKEHVEFVNRYGDALWKPDQTVEPAAPEVQLTTADVGKGLMEQIAGVSSDQHALEVIRRHPQLLGDIAMSVKSDGSGTPFSESVCAFVEKYEPLISGVAQFGWLFEPVEGALQPEASFLAEYDQCKDQLPTDLVEFVDRYRHLFAAQDEAQGNVEVSTDASSEDESANGGDSFAAWEERGLSEESTGSGSGGGRQKRAVNFSSLKRTGVSTSNKPAEPDGQRTARPGQAGSPDVDNTRPGDSHAKREKFSNRELDAALSARGSGTVFVEKWLALICRRYDVDPEKLKYMSVKLTYTDVGTALQQAHAGGGLVQPGKAGKVESSTRHIFVSIEEYVTGAYVEKLDKSKGGAAALVSHKVTWPSGIPDEMKRELTNDPMKTLKFRLDKSVETGGGKLETVGNTIAKRISDRYPKFSEQILNSGEPLSISVNNRNCELSNCFVFRGTVYFDDDASTCIRLDTLNAQLATKDGPPPEIKMLLLQRMMESDVDSLVGGSYSTGNVFEPRETVRLHGLSSGTKYGPTVSKVNIDQAASGSLCLNLGKRYLRHLGDSLSRATITQHDIRLKKWTRVGTAAFKTVGAYLGNMLGAKGTVAFAVASQVPALVETMLKDNPRGSAEDLCQILESVSFDVGAFAMGRYLKDLHDSRGNRAVQRVVSGIKKKIEMAMKSKDQANTVAATEKQALDQWAKGITDAEGGVFNFLSKNNREATETYIGKLRDNVGGASPETDSAPQSAAEKPGPSGLTAASQSAEPQLIRPKRALQDSIGAQNVDTTQSGNVPQGQSLEPANAGGWREGVAPETLQFSTETNSERAVPAAELDPGQQSQMPIEQPQREVRRTKRIAPFNPIPQLAKEQAQEKERIRTEEQQKKAIDSLYPLLEKGNPKDDADCKSLNSLATSIEGNVRSLEERTKLHNTIAENLKNQRQDVQAELLKLHFRLLGVPRELAHTFVNKLPDTSDVGTAMQEFIRTACPVTDVDALIKQSLRSILDTYVGHNLKPDSEVTIQISKYDRATGGFIPSGKPRKEKLINIAKGDFYKATWNGHIEVVSGLPSEMVADFRKSKFFGPETFPITSKIHGMVKSKIKDLDQEESKIFREIMWRGKVLNALSGMHGKYPEIQDVIEGKRKVSLIKLNNIEVNGVFAIENRDSTTYINVLTGKRHTIFTSQSPDSDEAKRLAKFLSPNLSLAEFKRINDTITRYENLLKECQEEKRKNDDKNRSIDGVSFEDIKSAFRKGGEGYPKNIKDNIFSLYSRMQQKIILDKKAEEDLADKTKAAGRKLLLFLGTQPKDAAGLYGAVPNGGYTYRSPLVMSEARSISDIYKDFSRIERANVDSNLDFLITTEDEATVNARIEVLKMFVDTFQTAMMIAPPAWGFAAANLGLSVIYYSLLKAQIERENDPAGKEALEEELRLAVLLSGLGDFADAIRLLKVGVNKIKLKVNNSSSAALFEAGKQKQPRPDDLPSRGGGDTSVQGQPVASASKEPNRVELQAQKAPAERGQNNVSIHPNQAMKYQSASSGDLNLEKSIKFEDAKGSTITQPEWFNVRFSEKSLITGEQSWIRTQNFYAKIKNRMQHKNFKERFDRVFSGDSSDRKIKGLGLDRRTYERLHNTTGNQELKQLVDPEALNQLAAASQSKRIEGLQDISAKITDELRRVEFGQIKPGVYSDTLALAQMNVNISITQTKIGFISSAVDGAETGAQFTESAAHSGDPTSLSSKPGNSVNVPESELRGERNSAGISEKQTVTPYGPAVEWIDEKWRIKESGGLRGGAPESMDISKSQVQQDKALREAVISGDDKTIAKLRNEGVRTDVADTSSTSSTPEGGDASVQGRPVTLDKQAGGTLSGTSPMIERIKQREFTVMDKLNRPATMKIEDAIRNPSGYCEAIMEPVGRFMRENGFSDIRYRGMAMWTTADEFQSNHFVVVGKKGEADYVFDLTAHQFANQGMPTLTGPLIEPHEKWVARYQQATLRKRIVYKDFADSSSAKNAFHSSAKVDPTEPVEGQVELTRPDWFGSLMKRKSGSNFIDSRGTKFYSRSAGNRKYKFATTDLEKTQLFTDGASKSNTLVITAHGDYNPKSGSVKVPKGTKFELLNPHGAYLEDPKISSITSGQRKTYATVEQGGVRPETKEAKELLEKEGFKSVSGSHERGSVRDYNLSAYESDSFEAVGAAVDANRQYASAGMGTKSDFLVITKKTSLSEVLAELEAKNIHYDNIVLGFCRGSDRWYKRGYTFDPKQATRLERPGKNTPVQASAPEAVKASSSGATRPGHEANSLSTSSAPENSNKNRRILEVNPMQEPTLTSNKSLSPDDQRLVLKTETNEMRNTYSPKDEDMPDFPPRKAGESDADYQRTCAAITRKWKKEKRIRDNKVHILEGHDSDNYNIKKRDAEERMKLAEKKIIDLRQNAPTLEPKKMSVGGGRFDLFSVPDQPADTLIVSAHGWFRDSSPTTKVAGNVDIHFPGPHGRTVEEPASIGNFSPSDRMLGNSGDNLVPYSKTSIRNEVGEHEAVNAYGTNEVERIRDYSLSHYENTPENEYSAAVWENAKRHASDPTVERMDMLTIPPVPEGSKPRAITLRNVLNLTRPHQELSHVKKIVLFSCREQKERTGMKSLTGGVGYRPIFESRSRRDASESRLVHIKITISLDGRGGISEVYEEVYEKVLGVEWTRVVAVN
ncbi:putative adhesin [Burkholderia pyrrocinia]